MIFELCVPPPLHEFFFNLLFLSDRDLGGFFTLIRPWKDVDCEFESGRVHGVSPLKGITEINGFGIVDPSASNNAPFSILFREFIVFKGLESCFPNVDEGRRIDLANGFKLVSSGGT